MCNVNEKHPEALKMFKNIQEVSDAQTAEEIAFNTYLPLEPTNEQSADWVNAVCSALENRFDDDTIKVIRQGCYCREDGKLDENKSWLKKLYNESNNIEQFVEKVNEVGAGWHTENDELYTKYFDCSCPMLNGIERLNTKTWCYCTAGFGKEIFDEVFGCEVEIEILKAIKMGDEFCLLKVKRK